MKKATLPTVESLLARHAAACDLKQKVDREKITAAMLEWCVQIGAPAEMKITFVASFKEIESAASAARDARAASAAWAASAASAAWAVWDASYISITAIGAVSIDDKKQAKIWLPILEAFEAGAFAFFVTDPEIFVATIPAKVKVDDQRRLHCEDGPAFVWLADMQDFYWHGTYVPEAWIMDRKSLTAKTALTWKNVEQRRAACEIVTWAKILEELKAKVIDDDPDPQIGRLVEATIPDIGKERFILVRCGTGRSFAIPVPPTTKTAVEGNMWTYGLNPEDYKIEVRT